MMDQSFSWNGGAMRCMDMGKRVEIAVDQQNDGHGLYKAWLRGSQGATLTLGTLMPDQKRLLLRRSLLKVDLERAGCWPIAAGGVQLAHQFSNRSLPSGWRAEPEPVRLFPHDPSLCKAAEQLQGCLLCHSGEGFSLAVPYETRRAFPLPALFCFARLRRLGEGNYVVFPFDHEGNPRF